MQCRNKPRLPMNKTNEVGGGDISAIALASPPDPASWDWKSNLAIFTG